MREPIKDLPARKSPFSDKVKGVEMFTEDWGDMACGCYRYPRGWISRRISLECRTICARFLHYGYCLKGAFHVRYKDGTEEVVIAGDLFCLPPPHTFWIDEDTEMIMFSPLKLMSEGAKLAQSNLGSERRKPSPHKPSNKYGHFGRSELAWERVDAREELLARTQHP